MPTDFVSSQGTEIFVLPPGAASALALSCPTSASKSGGDRNMTEILCLNAIDPEFIAGSRTPTTWSIPFALVPTDVSQQELFDLEDSGAIVPFVIALSDGVADPTVVDDALVPPAARTSFAFSAIVMGVGIDIATNDVVRGTLSLQVSGPVTRTWKS